MCVLCMLSAKMLWPGQAAGVDGAVAGIGDAMRLACGPECLIDMGGELLRDVEFISQFPHIADAHGKRARQPHIDPPCREERKGRIRHVVVGHFAISAVLVIPKCASPESQAANAVHGG